MYTDEELIEGCKKGNSAAQEALYKKYASRMRYICIRYARTSFETEDIFQEAFVKVFTGIEKYKGQGSFEGWIKRIFINSAIDYYKKNLKLSEQQSNYSEEEKYVYEEEEDCQFSEIANKLNQQDILEIVNTLPHGYKMVFNLFAIESYSHNQIADALNITVGTSKSQLAKARKMLKALIIEQLTKHKQTIELKLETGVIKLGESA